ncbi:MAG: hypothetical protein KDD89_16025, partial [Anaerolineales bacterium]|nr:hypothetical protein [Anaerolineales bacterium]
MMIVTACDSRYLGEARYLLRSCARHAPDQRLYLFLVNDQTPDSVIWGWNKNTLIERVTWDYEPARWRALMCCARSIPVASV